MDYRNNPHAVFNQSLVRRKLQKAAHSWEVLSLQDKIMLQWDNSAPSWVLWAEGAKLCHLSCPCTHSPVASSPPTPPLQPWYLWLCGQPVQRADPTNSYPLREIRMPFFKADPPHCLRIPLKYLTWALAMKTWPSKELPPLQGNYLLRWRRYLLVLKKFQSLPCLIL